MLTYHDLIVEMTERQRELERLVYPSGLVNRGMSNHVYRHLTGWRHRFPFRSRRVKPEAAGIKS